mgnify:CR=1
MGQARGNITFDIRGVMDSAVGAESDRKEANILRPTSDIRTSED